MTDEEIIKEARRIREVQKTKRFNFSKMIVICCISLVILYTVFCLIMQYKAGIQPEPQLTISFFGFIAVEVWSLSKIKRDKSIHESQNSNQWDDGYKEE